MKMRYRKAKSQDVLNYILTSLDQYKQNSEHFARSRLIKKYSTGVTFQDLDSVIARLSFSLIAFSFIRNLSLEILKLKVTRKTTL